MKMNHAAWEDSWILKCIFFWSCDAIIDLYLIFYTVSLRYKICVQYVLILRVKIKAILVAKCVRITRAL